MDCLLWGI